jgi:nucleotide-binding universal stress UspA family protein
MKKILILFSNVREKEEAIDIAIERAKEGNIHITFLYILDESIPREFSTWLMYMGFLGEKPTHEIKEIILEEVRKNAKDIVEGVKRRLEKEGIPHSILFLEGDFKGILEDLFKREKFDLVIVPKERETISGKVESIRFEGEVMEI